MSSDDIDKWSLFKYAKTISQQCLPISVNNTGVQYCNIGINVK